MEKQKSRAFKEDIYLLGIDEFGEKYWLVAPSWDCDWYWGFGYVQTYTNNNNPSVSRDISSHQHIDGLIGKVGETYIHNLYDAPLFTETTFSEEEGWELTELFKQFYLLQDMAEFTSREKPKCHIANTIVDHGNLKEWNKYINSGMIPAITNRILEILAPVK